MPLNQSLHQLICELIAEIQIADETTLKEFISKHDIFTLFNNSLHLSNEEIFQTYKKLALQEYELGISYSQFTDFIQLFTTKLINKASINFNDSLLIEKITEISSIIINAIAKGYLLELINDDIPALDFQLQEYVAIRHINTHLIWMKHIIFDIENESKKARVELEPTQCFFGVWTKTEEFKKFFTSHEIKEICRMHQAVHNSGKSIYYHLKNKKYHQVLLDYLFLSRLSINLVARLNTKITHQILRKQIETDYLTQLRNRHSLDALLKRTFILHKEEKLSCSLAMLDIDFFKKINDTFGHQIGDSVLQTISQLLKQNIQASDTIFRYGGEEFLIVFPQCNEEKAQNICERLRLVIQNHKFNAPLDNYSITISIGISILSEKSNNYQELIKKADTNLYQAKKEGRNRVIFNSH